MSEKIAANGLRATATAIPDVLSLNPKCLAINAVFSLKVLTKTLLMQVTGLKVKFVQDNHSRSAKGVLRGLHYQIQQPQGKLVRVVSGEVLDVAVDIRRIFTHFRQSGELFCSVEKTINSFGCHQVLRMVLWCCLKQQTFSTKRLITTHPLSSDAFCGMTRLLGIDWQLTEQPKLSGKDAAGALLAQAEVFA